jgi:hypothetical protein
MTPKYRCSTCSYTWDELEHSPKGGIEIQRLHDKALETLTWPIERGWAQTVEYRMFKHLLNNRGRIVTYAELYKINFRSEMPSNPREIAKRNGSQWAHAFLDDRIGDTRKKLEVDHRNPKIILKRPGIGYTIPVAGQDEPNDEGPISDRPQIVGIRRGIKEGSEVALSWTFGLIVLAIVLVGMILLLAIMGSIHA